MLLIYVYLYSMKWIELKDIVGGGSIFLFGCHPTQSAYKVKAWLKEKKPDVVVLYAGEHSRIREYQAAHWMHRYDPFVFHNYLSAGFRQNTVSSALQSLATALQSFADQHMYMPTEIVLVRAKKLPGA